MIDVLCTTALFLGLTNAQTFEPLPPPPQKGPPQAPGASRFSHVDPPPDYSMPTDCNLNYPTQFPEPSILSTRASSVPQLAVEELFRGDPRAEVYRESLQQMRLAREEATRRGNPSSPNREPTSVFLTPTAELNVCQPNMRAVASVNNRGDECFAFSDEDVRFAECPERLADIPNTDAEILRYYCVPENFQSITFMVICPNTDEAFRWHTLELPASCCAKRFFCNYTSYDSIRGPMRFT